MLTYSYTYTFNVIQIILCSFSFIFLVNLKKIWKISHKIVFAPTQSISKSFSWDKNFTMNVRF